MDADLAKELATILQTILASEDESLRTTAIVTIKAWKMLLDSRREKPGQFSLSKVD
jgi:hypothetical protein